MTNFSLGCHHLAKYMSHDFASLINTPTSQSSTPIEHLCGPHAGTRWLCHENFPCRHEKLKANEEAIVSLVILYYADLFRLLYPLKCAAAAWNSGCTLQWTSQQPVMLERCFIFSNTLPGATASWDSIRIYLH